MRQVMRLLPLAMLVALAACGAKTEEVQPLDWPFLESATSLSINGQAYSAYVARTEAHRRRALDGLAIKGQQAVAMVYPQLEKAPEVKFRNLPDPIDLVFIDSQGKALAVESVPAFSQSVGVPRAFAVEGSRLVLQLPKGAAETLKIARGNEVKTEPNLLAESDAAEAPMARVYFTKSEREDEKPVDAPFVSLKVLEKAEDCAQALKDRTNLKDGEGVIFPVSGNHEFWLKEVQGKVCAAYIERTQAGQTVLSAIFEGIEGANAADLDQPVYYSPTNASYLALWRGTDFFTKHGIERRSRVVLAGVDVWSAGAADYARLPLKFGEARLEARLARTPSERDTAIREAATLKPGKGVVLAWDDPADVVIEEAPTGANLWFVATDGMGKYTISQKVVGTGGAVDVKATTRFVISVPRGFEAGTEVELPYLVRDLRPWVSPVVFYNARARDVVRDRWPGAKDNLRARARVELAITDAEQRRGLMFREALKPNHGMLFIYKTPEELSYWMKNCRMDLSIAFVDDRGEITTIHNLMKAPSPEVPDNKLENYRSNGPAKYAIEMEAGWFEKNGIKVGDRVFIPPALQNPS